MMRLRPLHGAPRTTLERVAQKVWRYRIELIVVYIAMWSAAAVMNQIGWWL